MKIRFIDGDTTIKRLNGIIQEENGFKVFNAGKYYYDTKQIIIIRQEYWYITFFILTHELMHWIIDCIFPYKNLIEYYGKFDFDRDKDNNPILENGIYFNPKEIEIKPHFLHKWLDKYWKIPKNWIRERSFLYEAFRLNSSNISQIIKKGMNNELRR